jgi:hypothetical protein
MQSPLLAQWKKYSIKGVGILWAFYSITGTVALDVFSRSFPARNKVKGLKTISFWFKINQARAILHGLSPSIVLS